MLQAARMVAACVPPFEAPGDWLSVVLPRSADACYALFCDIERTPEWVPVLATAAVTDRGRGGRARKVAFQARLERATIGYSCVYRYDRGGRQIAWATPPRSGLGVRGMARFQPIADAACLATYALDVRVDEHLPRFADPAYALHASSATLAGFRAFAERVLA
jgi:uncharacterized membrane protein